MLVVTFVCVNLNVLYLLYSFYDDRYISLHGCFAVVVVAVVEGPFQIVFAYVPPNPWP